MKVITEDVVTENIREYKESVSTGTRKRKANSHTIESKKAKASKKRTTPAKVNSPKPGTSGTHTSTARFSSS